MPRSALRRDGRSVGGLYAANTLGAVAGTMLTTFTLIPMLGFKAALLVLAAANLLCAFGVLAGGGAGRGSAFACRGVA